jgi:hypothetical protein
MYKELLKHENFIISYINSEVDKTNYSEIINYSIIKIKFFQHERLIHLLVTLSFGFFLLLTIISAVVFAKISFALLSLLLVLLLIPYILHYYKLENGVQRLYKLHDMIYKKFEKL